MGGKKKDFGKNIFLFFALKSFLFCPNSQLLYYGSYFRGCTQIFSVRAREVLNWDFYGLFCQ